ncbi:hypothetical protein CDAR_100471 [Caerostris darwini]|uniref:Uncharacterized protein n=1 Tax=Caerostris darwini TaxID=1538125 RepID=A0AAV4X1L2_9ARAC|nr:hypothetical protein CDAR_100471 [Caerostris darwini]
MTQGGRLSLGSQTRNPVFVGKKSFCLDALSLTEMSTLLRNHFPQWRVRMRWRIQGEGNSPSCFASVFSEEELFEKCTIICPRPEAVRIMCYTG